MSRRFPNEPHWQRLVATFREIAGRSWRTTAAAWSRVERKDLRARVDRVMTNAEIAQVDRVLIGSLKRHLRDLDERREHVANMIREIQRTSYERSPYCQIERAVIFDDSAPELTLDELLAGYPPLLRAAWADLLSD